MKFLMIKKGIRGIKSLLRSQSRDPKKIIKEFNHALCEKLKHNLKGIYVIGSLGLDDFNQHLSDIDFIVTIDTALSKKEIREIETIHRKIERKSIQPNLNGIYILERDLGKKSSEIKTLTWFHEGTLYTATNKTNYYEINPITWAEFSLNAITYYGKPPSNYGNFVHWVEINNYMFGNINSYWRKWLIKSKDPLHPYFYLTLFKKETNAWCVAGVARQLFTLKRQEITSKKKACAYFLDKVPDIYKQILIDTINFRNGFPTRPSWQQKRYTLRFMEYCINTFNGYYKNGF